MYGKLILRSARRSVQDYLIYLVTLTLCVGLFYAFLSISSRYYHPALGAEFDLSFLSEWMKLAICGVTLLLLFLIRYVNRYMTVSYTHLLLREPAGSTEDWENPYIDVTQDLWSYQYITELNKAGVLPSSEKFQGQEEETRGNLVLYLYNMDQGVFKDRKKSRDKKKEKAAPNFTDVTKDSPYYDAVCWAYQNGLVGGTTETTFAPEHSLTREQVCTVVARFAACLLYTSRCV